MKELSDRLKIHPAVSHLPWNGLLLDFALIGWALLLRYKTRRSMPEKALRLVVPILFLFISELIIFAAANSTEAGWIPVLIGCALSYLPIRLILIFTPPKSPFELLTAVSAFAFFIYQMIGARS